MSFWTNFYDNIYEHPERPDQNVISNDDLLDKWVEDQSKDMEDRAKKNSRQYKNKLSSSAYDHDEVIYFDEEEWEEVLEEETENDDEFD